MDASKNVSVNVQQSEGLHGQVNSQVQTVENIVSEAVNNPCSLEQELAQKTGELDAQRKMREYMLVDITLNRIADCVVPKGDDVMDAMNSGRGLCENALRELVAKEIMRAANGLLWCREYVEKLRSDQHMLVYTGSHWEVVEAQQWKDFVSRCAERCGIPESQRMKPSFMRQLYESVSFNFAEYRRRIIPDGEVWLNMQNGKLVLSSDGSVTLHEHDKDDLFTYTLPYSYDAQAECPQWHRFINRVLPEPESQDVLAEFIGYTLMPRHLFEKMLWLYGEGQNGKSVTLEIIEALLGHFNVSYLSLSDLTNDEVKRAGIEGKMLNISHESGKDVNPNVLKQLVSGERVIIKYLYRDPYETRDYGKFIAAFNELPRAEITFGFFRRLIILGYSVTIPEEEKDEHLSDKLKQELPGILNWVLKALPRLMKQRAFTDSENCRNALEQYRLQSDSVKLFCNEICEKSEFTTTATEIFSAYHKYCMDSSLRPVGKHKFYKRLENLGYSRSMYGNNVHFNLKLIEQ